MALQGKHWAMIGGAVAVALGLALAPRTPAGKADANAAEAGSARVSEDPNSGSTPHAEDAGAMPVSKDPAVNAILTELNNGGAPMETILKLRKLSEEQPNNIEAQYHLGIFSWQTGQYDKAMARFQKVIAMDPKGYPDAYAFLGQAYGTLDSTDKAIAALETYKTLVTDTALLNGADRFLADLKTKKTK
jgi:tetratricopeptide (TPR) repeat protein